MTAATGTATSTPRKPNRAPKAASDYSVTWDWDGFAYVCDYRVPSVQPQRVGIIDAFHGDERRRHGLDRRPR